MVSNLSSSSSSSAVRRRASQKKSPNKPQKGKRSVARTGYPQFEVGQGALVTQPLMRIRNGNFRVTQSFESVGNATSSVVANTYTANYVTGAAFDQFASFATVFDQYKIEMVEVTYIPQNAEGSAITNTGLFTCVVDHDDALLLTSVAQAMDYPEQQTVRGSDIIRFTFQPNIALAAYSGSFSSYANVHSQWIDTNSASVQHYGWKTAWSPTSVALVYNTIVRVNFAFRSVR